MSFVHGKNVYWSIAGTDLSAFGDATDPERTADSHETTTYGNNSKTYEGGLIDGTCTIGGLYDNGASSTPQTVIEPALGTTVAYVYRPEGTGTGLPQKSVQVVITKYTESAPVGDMIRWSADLQFTGNVTITTQA